MNKTLDIQGHLLTWGSGFGPFQKPYPKHPKTPQFRCDWMSRETEHVYETTFSSISSHRAL